MLFFFKTLFQLFALPVSMKSPTKEIITLFIIYLNIQI